ncbi:unnamed protein product [Dovyalis caffra]|uniref:Uncharacterized protein n=1 Tax=Dovyalis caffra TaxID=77055 RepID=A0AAV1QVL7_9ROSI|nr:unnamed protein product [Dovyalis caffra]
MKEAINGVHCTANRCVVLEKSVLLGSLVKTTRVGVGSTGFVREDGQRICGGKGRSRWVQLGVVAAGFVREYGEDGCWLDWVCGRGG